MLIEPQERRNGAKAIFVQVTAEYFLKLMKDTNLEIQEFQPKQIKKKKRNPHGND